MLLLNLISLEKAVFFFPPLQFIKSGSKVLAELLLPEVPFKGPTLKNERKKRDEKALIIQVHPFGDITKQHQSSFHFKSLSMDFQSDAFRFFKYS